MRRSEDRPRKLQIDMIAGACLLASANPNRASPHHCGHARLRRQAKATQEILKGALRAQRIEGTMPWSKSTSVCVQIRSRSSSLVTSSPALSRSMASTAKGCSCKLCRRPSLVNWPVRRSTSKLSNRYDRGALTACIAETKSFTTNYHRVTGTANAQRMFLTKYLRKLHFHGYFYSMRKGASIH